MESLVFNIAERVLDRLASRAYGEISLAWGVSVELNKLKETLETITVVLQDAEEKRTKDRRIIQWLGKLKDVCYEADYVLDEFEYQKKQMQLLNRGSIKGKVHNLFSSRNPLLFRFKMGRRIKDIRERLGEIANEKNQFCLFERDRGWHEDGEDMKRKTHAYVQVSDVIGRDNDQKQIINHLLKDIIGQGDQNVSVISIVGLGGLGKTTLAKLVYNNNKVDDKFELRMWVCVSDNFDEKRLFREVIKSAIGENYRNESLDQMQIKLRDTLRDKRFLLVLDDVWDKEPMGITQTRWSGLKTLLNVGGKGSKIMITTRTESVASLMGSIHMHSLQLLPHKDYVFIH